MVFVERATAEFFRAVHWLSEAFAVEQGLPIQGGSLRKKTEAPSFRVPGQGCKRGAAPDCK
nr:hypothetical protein FFPRI1PSEUD_49810 [Pseudomonas sp. FFPRI_1]